MNCPICKIEMESDDPRSKDGEYILDGWAIYVCKVHGRFIKSSMRVDIYRDSEDFREFWTPDGKYEKIMRK